MRVDRLERLIAVLERDLPVDEFDMSSWVRLAPVHTPDCGTSACALGCWALSPEGEEDGWLVDWDRESVSWRRPSHTGRPEVLDATVAAMEYFGLLPHQAGDLFLPSSYRRQSAQVTRQDVVRRIRRMILTQEMTGSGIGS